MRLRDIDVGPKAGFTRFIRREPLGVVLTIAAWNYPYLIAVNSVVPAIMAGNAVILKHSAQTPLCAEQFAASFREAGLPEGVFQVLHLTHADTERVIRDARVGFVAFTGSVEGGHAIQRAAAERFIGTGLELGGNDPAYVRADANFAHAVENLVDGAFFNSGQSCCGIGRIYVHEALYDRFVEAFVDLTASTGSAIRSIRKPLSARSCAPQAADSIRRSIAQAVKAGARPLIDEEHFAASRPGTPYLAPQVLVDVRPDMPIMQEETFGPLVSIARVDFRRGSHPPDERQPLRADRLGLDRGREGRDRDRRSHRDRNLVHEPLRLSRSGAGVGGREGFGPRLHAVSRRLRAPDAAEVVSPAGHHLNAAPARVTDD